MAESPGDSSIPGAQRDAEAVQLGAVTYLWTPLSPQSQCLDVGVMCPCNLTQAQSEAEPLAAQAQSEVGSAHARARRRLEALLNRSLRVRMSDGRTLVGCFLCTDRDANVILGSAHEFLKPSDSFSGAEPRVLGLAMVPGHHIVSIEVELEPSRP
ncbi:N-alpha-acetyltransferase 38, NatC auxiliary subunit isoform X1 [Alligator mississippiensis]|uniref:N(Alpha)-acetyltransferase 38, NatC auxiliary subunit n=1 Tax=Alligator mississippiensis TaxID=8496 RepID=A0A151N440_ALLMI|nr:N-alpha-acetyltransferase 38, NatC auxiliary subunit isoform X1 [Alligator mississippiensis]KYO31594.1 N(alpha)-acetyltransferase 38, NatC auxiliary subunit [Alligator mississippiensis]